MDPLKLIAPCKESLWGGTKLKTEYGKATALEKVAESWELCCREDSGSIIENGEFAGASLREYLLGHKREMGFNCAKFGHFPILIKMIDANQNLSVQVHPDAAYGMHPQGALGMTKMWYILDCEPDATILFGLNRRYTRQEFRDCIAHGKILESANFVKVKKGDVFFVEPGLLHAMGGGILAVEIQQNADVSYRVYDFDRLDTDGRPRDLQVERALDVLRLNPPARSAKPQEKPVQRHGYWTTLLVACEYFTANLIRVEKSVPLCANQYSFQSLLCLDGSGTLHYQNGFLPVKKGDSIFVPAGLNNYKVEGSCDLLFTTI